MTTDKPTQTAAQGQNVRKGDIVTHKNGNHYYVLSGEGSFYDKDNNPIAGKIAVQILRNEKPFGPMREMLIKNLKRGVALPRTAENVSREEIGHNAPCLKGKYVDCPKCKRSTRVEVHFENDQLILWCGHYAQA